MSLQTVSIFLLTYNQEHFIGKTIESVLMQKTNFDYQLVIGEDCSTDDTRGVCEEYQKNEPTKIKLLPKLDKNIGLISNYLRTIKECDGKYIAICDGDDYWIDEFKLQKQVDFLEQNINCKIVHTNLNLLSFDGVVKKCFNDQTSYRNDTFTDLIERNPIYSVTVMFRNFQDESALPLWVLNHYYGDYPTFIWVLKDGGEIGYLEDVTAVYRKNIGESSKLKNTVNLDLLIYKDAISDNNFSKTSQMILEKRIVEIKFLEVAILNKDRKFILGFIKFFKLFLNNRLSFFLIRMYFYSLIKHLKIFLKWK